MKFFSQVLLRSINFLQPRGEPRFVIPTVAHSIQEMLLWGFCFIMMMMMMIMIIIIIIIILLLLFLSKKCGKN